jgi:hypothetical protein
LPIRWHRLVKDDRTCDRCAATGEEVERAVEVLADVLRPLGMQVSLELKEIDAAAFADDPDASNRIRVAGKPLDNWIGAKVGSSRCCSVCGDTDCRTIRVDRTSFEAIPQWLILKAALVAASTLLDDSEDTGRARSCPAQPVVLSG